MRGPTAVATSVTQGREWAGVAAGPFIWLGLELDYCLAAAWMAWATDSGVPVRLAFDHKELLAAAIARVRAKVEYTSLPVHLVEERLLVRSAEERSVHP